MFPASRARLAAATLTGLLLAGLLPTAALAAVPVAHPDGYTVGVNAAVTTFDVLANDTDADVGHTLTVNMVSDPAHGMTVNQGSDIDYTPDTDFRGTDTFQYTVKDETLGVSAPATVTVIVNDAPIAVNDPGTACQPAGSFGGSYPIPEDYLETGPFGQWLGFLNNCALLTNDSDPNGDPLTYVIDSGPSHGDLFPDPQVTAYKPDPNYSTPFGDFVSDSITYRAFDGLSYSQPATMHFWISPVNDPPTFTPGGTVTLAEDTGGTYSTQWATNVSPGPNESSQTVHFELVNQVPQSAHCATGTLFPVHEPAIDSNGMLTFSVDPDCWGSAHVTFRAKDDGGTSDPTYGSLTPHANDTADDVSFDINITPDGVSGVNDPFVPFEPPITVPDDPGTPWLIDVLANDTFPPGSQIVAVTQGTLGTVAIAPDGLSLLYTPDANVHGTDSFTYTLSDGAGSQDTPKVTLSIAAINDPPDGTDGTVSTNIDVPYVFGSPDFGFTDPDDVPANNFAAVTITTLPANGSLEIDGGPVLAGDSISVADLVAGKLVFTPGAGEHAPGYATFTFQVQDDGGTADGGVDLDPTPNTMTIDVVGPNHAPAGMDGDLSTPEDTALPVTAADFGFTDPDDTPANDLLAVKIAALPLAGSLADDGNAVGAGDVIPVADIIGNKLVFTPAANASGDDYATLTFQVQDDGGTGGGGADTDPTANTLTISVTPVNDAPSGTDAAVTGVEDTPKTIGAGDFGFSDVNDSPPDTLAAVRITTLPGSGTLKDGMVAVSAGDFVPVADVVANKLVYTPAANANGNPLTTFTFQVRDGGGTLNGGVDLDPTPNTLTINVTPVNDPPHAGNDTGVTIPESAGPTSIAVLANDTDVDGDTLTITSVTQGGHGAVAITGGGAGLTYDPAQLYVGTDTFKYTIDDSHGGTFQATVLVAVVRDTTKPIVSGLAESFYAQTVATSTTGETISWSGSDAGSGIAKFELQVSVNGGAYTSIALATLTSTSINRAHADDTSYRYRVRATDKEGNVSAWLNGPPWRLGRVQDDSASIVYTGSWAASADPSALGGSHRSASSSGDRASIKLSVRDVAWVATKTATSGSAQVWIDGVLDATINLHASTTTFRQLVFSHRFSTLGTHTIEIRPVGDGPIDLDAFLIVREPFLGVGSPPRSTS